ncbi:hypothetical protein HanLR1_Chr03g0082961 [Helianthus annuus]|nr:hypothetical protein HanLR1_Chr03g0082961 [Helianthus annuus]
MIYFKFLMKQLDMANGWGQVWSGHGSKRVNYKKGLFWFGSKRVRVRTGFGSGSGQFFFLLTI